MTTFRTGDMWSVVNDVDFFVVTANSYIKQSGALVMGRGIARQLRDTLPVFAKTAGMLVNRKCGHLGEYNLLICDGLGLLQVKYDFRDQADIELIRRSIDTLREHAEARPGDTYAVNYPGIGNGRIDRTDELEQIVSSLPDNVQVWTYE